MDFLKMSNFCCLPGRAGGNSRFGLAKHARHHNDVAKAMEYMLKRWPAFTRFLDDGRIRLSTMPRNERCAGLPLAESRG